MKNDYEILTEDNHIEYEQFLSTVPNCDFLQTMMWSSVKQNWSQRIIVTRNEHKAITAGMLVLIRKVPFTPFTFLYAPRGPIFSAAQYSAVLPALMQGLTALAKQEKAFAFKADPAIAANNNDFILHAKNARFRLIDTGKNFDGVQPRYVYVLNLKGKTADEVFAAFHSKTRYNIRLSQRKGVTVRLGGHEDLAQFYEIMTETAERDNFNSRPLKYFQNMFHAIDSEHLRLYVAEFEGRMIAATIAIFFGDTVWYLYGASSNKHRNTMPNYLLQWEMIQWAIEKNCSVYDFLGISGDDNPDNPLHGLYRFKSGFSGETIEYVGELEVVFKPLLNKLVNLLRKFI